MKKRFMVCAFLFLSGLSLVAQQPPAIEDLDLERRLEQAVRDSERAMWGINETIFIVAIIVYVLSLIVWYFLIELAVKNGVRKALKSHEVDKKYDR